MRLYSEGRPTGTAEYGAAVDYASGFSTASNPPWMYKPVSGCAVRVRARNTSSTRAAMNWTIPEEHLDPMRASRALTVEAFMRADKLWQGYGKYSVDIFGVEVGWDRQLKLGAGIWSKAVDAVFRTRADLRTYYWMAPGAAVEAAISPGSWHHVALTANETACAIAVDGKELGSQPCNATLMIPNVDVRNWITINLGGIDGWVDEIRLSSAWRQTQPPNSPAIPLPPAPPPLPPRPRCPPATLVDANTVFLLAPAAAACKAVTNLSAPLGVTSPVTRASYYVNGTRTSALAPATVFGQVFASLEQLPPRVAAAGCAIRLSPYQCGNCAWLQFKLTKEQMARIIKAGVLTLDVKLRVDSWVNTGIDTVVSTLGWLGGSDRYFKVFSDWQARMTAAVAHPSAAVDAQGLQPSGNFMGWQALGPNLHRKLWHHVAISMNTTSCAVAVDGAVLAPVARCNVTAAVNVWAEGFFRVGGFSGLFSDLRMSTAPRATFSPEPLATEPVCP